MELIDIPKFVFKEKPGMLQEKKKKREAQNSIEPAASYQLWSEKAVAPRPSKQWQPATHRGDQNALGHSFKAQDYNLTSILLSLLGKEISGISYPLS